MNRVNAAAVLLIIPTDAIKNLLSNKTSTE